MDSRKRGRRVSFSKRAFEDRGFKMQKVKILGSWDQTYIVRDSSDAIKQAKKLNDRYPHLNLRIHGINHLGDIGEDAR